MAPSNFFVISLCVMGNLQIKCLNVFTFTVDLLNVIFNILMLRNFNNVSSLFVDAK